MKKASPQSHLMIKMRIFEVARWGITGRGSKKILQGGGNGIRRMGNTYG